MVIKKLIGRKRRQVRSRKKITGTNERPRLCVFISNRNIYVQLIDDVNSVTLASASTVTKDLKDYAANKEGAATVGKKIAEIAKTQNIEKVVFDRAGYQYHGVVKTIADAARQAGLKF
jgi:large subunit ribosomal protein L18